MVDLCFQCAGETFFCLIDVVVLVLIIKVQETPVKRLCKTHNIITVNGQYPGPTLEVREGDTLVINVVNRAQYNVTIHWYVIHLLRCSFSLSQPSTGLQIMWSGRSMRVLLFLLHGVMVCAGTASGR